MKNDSENNILDFDPTVINDNEILGFDPTQLEVFKTDDNWDEYERIEKLLEETHIQHCLKNKKFTARYPKYVYLAGKIEKNGWREEIVGYRCGDLYGGEHSHDEIANHNKRYNKDTIITGPWFLACDHGCYHGDNSHGLGINQLGDPEAFGDHYTEEDVYNICIYQIKRSDIVFAYINDDTCYGSIYEIAYAIATGKYVVIIFDNEKLMSKMWFMCQGAQIVEILDKDNIKEKFDEILVKISY